MRNSVYLIILLFVLSIYSCKLGGQTPAKDNENKSTAGVEYLTTDQFKLKVFDYVVNKEWKFAGDKPVIVDFYATWCGPCKMMSPIMEELAKKYAGKVVFYKVDTDKESELSRAMGIQSLPTFLFIPLGKQPQASMGAMPKENIEKAINELLLTTSNKTK